MFHRVIISCCFSCILPAPAVFPQIIESIFELILEHPPHTWQDYSTGPWRDIWMTVALLSFYLGLCIIKWWIGDFLNAILYLKDRFTIGDQKHYSYSINMYNHV